MDIKTTTAVLIWLGFQADTHTLICLSSLRILRKINRFMPRKELVDLLSKSRAIGTTWFNCLGCAGIRGNKSADSLAGNVALDGTKTRRKHGQQLTGTMSVDILE